ncbi:MAG: hypothetical protein A3A94_02195 [Candidatus Portnoybacteria bacterium RIFCSPLOWO2_01_FULL_43_11]|uniref:Uncharacterized protein n=3 Tax=Candidatus Portnoyibacteriota TaxID=1817913 RepID=A0A1G2FCM3_9BACT|nr:MAG: hypothetical protein A2815_02000 [Candidatus Portnoybacteria bacterium RIFCSPHIGHO2_01_FULL_40_12b]OGZ37177.1 MAG: hypothetical protein A3D38_01415 [Candidatus Portnoybacteria bacterium RIFCSPHIGHO2_02_FULL_40_23]OGZ38823.1 MAG: hypothetical protein A3A94_02195 [Candidatus Portnoybacteria bacterium RIFCSPLOWO2_01_FULL_43_11]OGZ40411.1 MAG: hypothetical protein A3I20_01900 [Candidatus Portnoybacteria bacterium RIFCSPLOWO2_02_FULL_40_15]
MKKYKVSLALKIPANFEIEINTSTKKKALEKALEKYHNGKFNEKDITDPDWGNIELDINENSNIDDIGNGIFIEEIK